MLSFELFQENVSEICEKKSNLETTVSTFVDLDLLLCMKQMRALYLFDSQRNWYQTKTIILRINLPITKNLQGIKLTQRTHIP